MKPLLDLGPCWLMFSPTSERGRPWLGLVGSPLWVHTALKMEKVSTGMCPGALRPAEQTLLLLVNLARGVHRCLWGPHPNRGCLSFICGTSSPIWDLETAWAKQLFPITCLSHFSSPLWLPNMPTPLPTESRDTVRKGSHFHILGQIGFVLFLEKNIK